MTATRILDTPVLLLLLLLLWLLLLLLLWEEVVPDPTSVIATRPLCHEVGATDVVDEVLDWHAVPPLGNVPAASDRFHLHDAPGLRADLGRHLAIPNLLPLLGLLGSTCRHRPVVDRSRIEVHPLDDRRPVELAVRLRGQVEEPRIGAHSIVRLDLCSHPQPSLQTPCPTAAAWGYDGAGHV